MTNVSRVLVGIGAVAFDPYGKFIVFEGEVKGRGQLYRRALDESTSLPIGGTEGGYAPFLSPDGQWLGFTRRDSLLKVALAGGLPIEITKAPAVYGASWGDDGRIVFSAQPQTGLQRVSADGGPVETITTLLPEDAGDDHRWPQVLPGSSAVIFSVGTGPEDSSRIVLLDLRTGARRDLVRGAASARYVATGHFVYARDAQLFAVPFDLESRSVRGAAERIAHGVIEDTDGAPEYSFTRAGDLIFVPGLSGGQRRTIALVNMKGTVTKTDVPLVNLAAPQVSPDGTRVAYTVAGAKNNIFVYDLQRQSTTRATLGRYHSPVWTPDGRLTLAEGGSSDTRIVVRAADGSGTETELVPRQSRTQFPDSWTPDGRTLYYRVFVNGQSDVWTVSPGIAPPRPFLSTPFNEMNARVSPDGRFLAYTSNETGGNQIYVRRLDDAGSRQQVSARGATFSAWAPDGRRLYYRGTIAPDVPVGLWAVDIGSGPVSTFGAPRLLFSNAGFEGKFDLTRDGTRFVMFTTDPSEPPDQLQLILNALAPVTRRSN
jgi:eukaryotic-like serine/threonine-protein kinase